MGNPIGQSGPARSSGSSQVICGRSTISPTGWASRRVSKVPLGNDPVDLEGGVKRGQELALLSSSVALHGITTCTRGRKRPFGRRANALGRRHRQR
jgi:hypothetical protein